MKFRNYLKNKKIKNKKQTDKINTYNQSCSDYKDIAPIYFPNVSQPAGGPFSGTGPIIS
jgi:hypothetical protein